MIEPHQAKWLGKMRVYFLADSTACGFYRCELPAMYMRLGGIAQTRSMTDDMVALGAKPYLTPQFKISSHYRDLQKKAVEDGIDWADVVVLQRMGGSAALELIDFVKRKGKALVHETDDLCEMVPEWSAARWYWQKPEVLDVYAKAMDAADLITTTTERLAENYRRKHKAPVATLMNMIDYGSERWARGEYVKGEPHVERWHPTGGWGDNRQDGLEPMTVRVGWMGSETHFADMELLRDVIPWLLETYPQVRFEFFGYLPAWAAALPEGRWGHCVSSNMEVPSRMAKWDIGLAPVIAHEFNTIGKSDVKFLEYACAFAATLASNLPPYTDHMEPGGTGLLAQWDDPDSWRKQLKKLIERPNWRWQMVLNAHEYVRKSRNAGPAAALWFKAYADALSGKRGGE